MKLGVLQFFSWPGRHGPLEDVYARALERIEIMDRGGFDAVWLAEHHFTTFSVCPSVPMFGTLAAARTKRLRIGTAVSLAALYHPLRLAEEVALLDMLSGGRVNWGAGRGFAQSEFRLRRAGRGKRGALSRGRRDRAQGLERGSLHLQGRAFLLRRHRDAAQAPAAAAPPIWMAATSESAIDWAASRGFSILMDPHSSTAELGAKRRRYGEKLAEAGFSDAGRDIPMARLLALAPTSAEALAVARRGAQWLVDSYAGPQHPRGQSVQRTSTARPAQHYIDSVVLHGSPAAVVDQITRLKRGIGLDS